MSRGFEGFEIDDFRGSKSDSGRDIGRSSSSEWSKWTGCITFIGRKRAPTDLTANVSRSGETAPRVPGTKECKRSFLSASVTNTRTGDKDYSLRDSEIHALSEVGKFRVVATRDLAEFAYNGDRSRVENDVESLVRQGLMRQNTIADPEHNPTQVVTLTKEGHKLLSRGKILPSSQATYHGLKKPKEAFHDADLYRLYHKVGDEIENRGGRVLRVQLDYEMKQELYVRLARASQDKSRNLETLRKEIAERYHLKVVSGRIPIPDLRIEYVNENENEIQRRDLELATEHYRPRGLAQKARAGFQIYARHGETDRLRRIRDDRELSTAILGF